MEKHIAILSFNGDPNVGLYGVATNRFCLLGRSVPEKNAEQIKEVLKVPVFQVGLYGTDLVGLFCVANSKAILLPEIIFDKELEELKKNLKPLGVQIHILKTEHTAFGNNILLSDKFGIISSAYSKKNFYDIKKFFPEIKFEQMELAGTSVPGSVGVLSNKGGVFSVNLSEEEIKKIEKLLGFEIGLGTVNMGNPFVSSGIIANSNGFVIGRASSGWEMARVDESLGFLK